MKKKIILTLLCALLFSTVAINITVAFLTDSEKRTNIYSIGKIAITLNETDVNELGVPIEGANRVYENEYHLMPGYTYVKDPTITINKGSSESYIRMLVTINKIQELKKIFGSDFKLETLVNGLNKDMWILENIKDNVNNSSTYEYRYYKTVSGYENETPVTKKLEPLFESFTIPEIITGEQLQTIKDLEWTVVGHAVQSEGFENEKEAWESFGLQSGEK